jgi:cell wall-associated NlpC family hydrolase
VLNTKIPRDAADQVKEGEIINFISDSKKGDLAFFDNEEGEITHVGIVIGENEIIHASGKVRIDKLDQQGIYNRELNKYTHKLRVIKRII